MLTTGSARKSPDLTLMAFLGGYVWDDLESDGVRDPGEPRHAGVVVNLLDSTGTMVSQKTTPTDGFYNFGLPGAPAPFRLQFVAPGGVPLTLQDQGADDTLDSDVDPATGLSPLVGPSFTIADATGWSAGLLCGPPSLPITITGARVVPGPNDVTFDFTDPNPSGQVTGYKVYRSSQPPPPAPWTLLGSDVADNDPVAPNIQWADPTAATPAVGGVFYYQITAFNHICNLEGPR